MSQILCGGLWPQDRKLGADGKHIQLWRGAWEKGRDGVPRRMRENGVTFQPLLETITDTGYKSTLGICALPSTLTDSDAAMPNKAFSQWTVCDLNASQDANNICKQYHLVVTQLLACLVMNVIEPARLIGVYMTHIAVCLQLADLKKICEITASLSFRSNSPISLLPQAKSSNYNMLWNSSI